MKGKERKRCNGCRWVRATSSRENAVGRRREGKRKKERKKRRRCAGVVGITGVALHGLGVRRGISLLNKSYSVFLHSLSSCYLLGGLLLFIVAYC